MKFLADFFPILLFFIAYKLYGIYAATAVAIAASLLQVGWHWLRTRKVETMHLVTLGILVVFGGLTIALHDRAFIMWKPSVVNWLFAAVFLGSHFVGDKPLIERMMSHAIEVPAPIWRRLNQLWVLFFLAMGAANLFVANQFFTSESALLGASGLSEIDFEQCAALFSGDLLALCETARAQEETWVNFKLFGMMGLTFAFVIAQAFYLARHVRDEEAEEAAQ
jgi:intracellular septation protein